MGSSGVKAVLTVLGLAVAGNWGTGALKSNIEHKIKNQLPSLIGPAENYDVRVSAGFGQLLSGKLGKLQVHADSVFMRDKLEAESLDITMQEVRFSLGSGRFKRAQHAETTATISSDQLQRYLTRKYQDVTDIECSLEPNRFFVRAKPGLAGFVLKVDSEGTLKISGKDSISFDLEKVTAAGVKAPAFVTNYLTNRFNPVFEMSELGLNARLTELKVSEGRATLKAELDVSKGLVTK